MEKALQMKKGYAKMKKVYGLRVALLVTIGILWGSILGPVLFNIFINYSNKDLEIVLSKFVDDANLGGVLTPLRV